MVPQLGYLDGSRGQVRVSPDGAYQPANIGFEAWTFTSRCLELQGSCGRPRTGYRHSGPTAQDAAEKLTETAARIDPSVYSPAADDNSESALVTLRSAIQDLDDIPDEIRPTTATPMSDSLRSVLTELESANHG